MKITAIVTTYNRKYEARRALDSIYSQTVMPDEIILVDDLSTDGTREYLDSFSFKNLQYICLSEHKGAGAARNEGIRKATGDYIAFLDSDNEWYQDKIECFQKVLAVYEDSKDIIFSDYIRHCSNWTTVEPSKICEAGKEQIGLFIPCVIDASAAMYRKDLLEEVGLFSESMVTNIDWELLLHAHKKRDISVCKLEKTLTENWAMFDGLSENLELEQKERLALFGEYHRDIVESGYGLEFYKEYMKGVIGAKTEADAVNILLAASGYAEEWTSFIFNYHLENEKKYESNLRRKASFYSLLYRWMEMKLAGEGAAERLMQMGYQSVAIYGAGNHGRLLYEDIKNSEVEVRYFIDKNKNSMPECGLTVYTMDEELPEVDVIIITPYLEQQTIVQELKQKGDYTLLPLDRLI